MSSILDLPDIHERDQALRQLEAASPDLARMLSAGIPPDRALARVGLQHAGAGRFADAARWFRVAVAFAPDAPDAWTNWGIALDRSGQTLSAVECFGKSLDLRPAEVDTWLLFGMAKRRLGDKSGAEAAYQSALALDPVSAAAWQCLGSIKEEMGQDEEAIACLLRGLKAGAVTSALCANLGKLFFQRCRLDEAWAAYHDAAQLDPGNAHYQRMLRDCDFVRSVFRDDALDDAIARVRQWVAEKGGDADAELRKLLETAIALLSGFNHVKPAIRLVEHYLVLWPGRVDMRYLLRALRGDLDLARSPDDYLVAHFDSFARAFDTQLVDRLGYDVPSQIMSVLDGLLPKPRVLDVLDLGCGTGLCGPLLRPWARRLCGVDISPRMIDLASARGVYDQLICAEIVATLEPALAAYDLIVATDVLIYFGDLSPLFAAVARALRENGRFAFSTESHVGQGYRVLPTGRFSQAADYVVDSAKDLFSVEHRSATTLRLHAGQRAAGNLFVLRRA